MKQERIDKINYYLDIVQEQSHREAPAVEEFTVR